MNADERARRAWKAAMPHPLVVMHVTRATHDEALAQCEPWEIAELDQMIAAGVIVVHDVESLPSLGDQE